MVLVNFFGNNIRDAPGGFVLILNIFCEISKLVALDSCEFAGALTQKCAPAICHVYMRPGKRLIFFVDNDRSDFHYPTCEIMIGVNFIIPRV